MKQFDLTISSRYATTVVSVVFLCSFLFFTGCKNKEQTLQHGASQAATAQEKEEQNRNLVEQVVQAAERQENFPDLTYLSGALGRLNSWLAEKPESPDFEPDPEFDALAAEFEALIKQVKRADELVKKFADESAAPTEGDATELQTLVDELSPTLHGMAERLHSNTFALFAVFVDELRNKLASAKEFQFADATETFQAQIRQLVQLPVYRSYNFETFATGLEEFLPVLKIDGKSFLPQDADYLRESVWVRDVFYWARGDEQDDLAVVLNLFDWTVKNIAPASPVIGQAGPISPRLWQTLLLGQGTATDRALVFIELLRQYRLDAFIVAPEKEEEAAQFPLVVGVRIDEEVYLFLPQYGLPIPAASEDAIALQDGVRFNKLATLNDVAKDDSILRRFDLPETPFPAKAEDFQNVVAQLVSTPFCVAARMSPLEREFSGSVNTVLTYSYSEQKKRVEALDHVADVKRFPDALAPVLEQTIFPSESNDLIGVYTLKLEAGESLEVSDSSSSSSTDESIADYTGNASQVVDETGAKKTFITPLWIGRVLYLRGGLDGERSAGKFYMQCRASERILKQEEASIPQRVEEIAKQYQEWSSSQNKAPDEDELRAIVNQSVQQFSVEIATKRFMKILSSLYIATLNDAAGDAQATLERLGDDSLRLGPNEAMGQDQRRAAAYLRARTLEKLNKYETAVARYQDLSQDPGANVRANWIAKLAGIEIQKKEVLEQTEDAPAQTEEAPAETETAPAQTEEAPAETESAPAQTEEAPAETEDAPAQTEEAPTETEIAPAQTEEAPAETEIAPAQTEEAPAETETAPAQEETTLDQTENVPTSTEEIPASEVSE